MKIEIPTASLFAALVCACTDETRYNLLGVYVNGPDVVATDGHRLLHIRHAESLTPDPVIIGREGVEALRKALGAKARRESVATWEGSGLDQSGSLTVGGLKVPAPPVDGDFPDWKQVVPDAGFEVLWTERPRGLPPSNDWERKPKAFEGFALNVDYLSDLGKVQKCFEARPTPGIRLESGGPLDPTRWKLACQPDSWSTLGIESITGVIMPMRM